jgi:hypothetical protein
LEFIAVPFLAAVSHFMGSSSISALKNINQGYVLYLTLIGKPSIGKTTAMSMV